MQPAILGSASSTPRKPRSQVGIDRNQHINKRPTSSGLKSASKPPAEDRDATSCAKERTTFNKRYGLDTWKPAEKNSQRVDVGVVGYSAGDAPEKRKNPDLYTELRAVPTIQDAPTPTPSQPPTQLLDLPFTEHQNLTVPGGPLTALPSAHPFHADTPAVSYMVTPAEASSFPSFPSSSAPAASIPATSSPPAPASSIKSTNTITNSSGVVATAEGVILSERASGAVVPLRHKPEVLAPVGGWPQLRAAVENGADAVYFGLEDFNARARAANFCMEELPNVMSYLHARGVKGFVALNVLVFDEELGQVEERVRAMAAAGVDAVIVQDWGVVSLMRRVAPALPVHGSTQMSITSGEGAAWVAGLGVERVVVGRELSVREIAKVREGAPGTEVEAFVHGAMCVSYSGQCFSSEAWGGRSANRGQCAQACRLPYGLLVDGTLRELGDVSYLLSPQDLMAVEQVPDLILAGVSCFKIEGRLKGPEYVALTTQVYRRAVDAAWSALMEPEGEDQGSEEGAEAARRAVALSDEQRWDLEQVFARGQDGQHRGLTPGFLTGVAHQQLVRGRAPRHRGVYLGRVEAVSGRGVVVVLQAPLTPGDGVVFDGGRPEEDEPGGTVYDILTTKSDPRDGATTDPRATLVLGPTQTEVLRRVSSGDLVWRTKDHALEARLRASYESRPAAAARRLAVAAAVGGRLGGPLTLTLTDPEGRSVTAASAVPLTAAARRPMSGDDMVRTLGPTLGEGTLRLDGEVDMTKLELDAGLFLPASELKSLRRRAVEALLAARSEHHRAAGLAPEPVLQDMLAAAAAQPAPPAVLQLLDDLSCTAAEKATDAAAATAADAAATAARAATGMGSSAPTSTSGRAAGAAGRGGPAGTGVSGPAGRVCVRVLCRTRAQAEAALTVPWVREVVLDFLEVLGLKEAVAAVRTAGRRVVVATPRVLKPDEQRLWMFYLRLGADALLVRSAGMMHQLRLVGGPGARVPDLPYPIPPLEGDFSLNSANVLSASLLLASGGEGQQPGGQQGVQGARHGEGPLLRSSPVHGTPPLETATNAVASTAAAAATLRVGDDVGPSTAGSGVGLSTAGGVLSRLALTHDLHAGQMAALAIGLGPRAAQLEAVVHQHLPIFHTEHCVFCRFLSSGNSYKDCGHPCERHTLHLRDDKSADHLVLADMGCRNTVFNASAQSGVFYIRDLIRSGIRTLRIELVDEQPQYVPQLLEGYRDVVLGRRGPGDLWRWLATLPDANGAVHDVDGGSLTVHKERSREGMKPTAAALKQQQQQPQ